MQAAVGRIGARPISDDQQLQLNIQTKGRLSSRRGVREHRHAHQSGRLGAARSATSRGSSSAPPISTARRGSTAGRPRSIAIYQSPGANAIADAEGRAQHAWPSWRSASPTDLAWKVTYDPTVFVTDTIHEVQKTLVEAFILVVLVVFLFLGSVRATLIPTFAVPVSLIGTFIVLLAIGYSANTVSLLAIVLAIGIVVDDAIVVVENVERVMEEHPELSPAEATKQAMAEITAPIIAITLVLLSVFVPVAFIPGISGELFRQFAVTVAVAMFLSAINALTLSPALCGVLLRPHHGPRRGADRHRHARHRPRARRLRRGGRPHRALLDHRSRHGRRRRASASSASAKVTPTGFLPEDDQGAFFVVVQLPGGASVARTAEVVRQAEAILKEEQAVEDYTSVDRPELHRQLLAVQRRLHGRHAQAVRGAQGAATRCAGGDRPRARRRSSGRSQGGTVVPLAPPPIIGLGTGGGFTYVLQDLRGGDPKALAQALRGLIVAANQDPQLSRVFTTFSATNPSIYLDIDRDKAQILGVPTRATSSRRCRPRSAASTSTT